MSLCEESRLTIWNAIGEFLADIAFIDQRWIRLDSCSNNTFTPKGGTQEIPYPIPSIADLLGVDPTTANEYLVAAGLLVPHRVHKASLSTNINAWGDLKSMYQLNIEVEQGHSFPWNKESFFPQNRMSWHPQQQQNVYRQGTS